MRKVAMMVATVAVALQAAAGVALAAEVTGTDGDDQLEGTAEADLIEALAGDDGLFGPDTYRGGEDGHKYRGYGGDREEDAIGHRYPL